MQSYFSGVKLKDFDYALIGLLGRTVTLKWKSGEVICVGTLHTHVKNPMGYFTVTPNSENIERDQWVMAYGEIATVDSDLYEISLAV